MFYFFIFVVFFFLDLRTYVINCAIFLSAVSFVDENCVCNEYNEYEKSRQMATNIKINFNRSSSLKLYNDFERVTWGIGFPLGHVSCKNKITIPVGIRQKK